MLFHDMLSYPPLPRQGDEGERMVHKPPPGRLDAFFNIALAGIM